MLVDPLETAAGGLPNVDGPLLLFLTEVAGHLVADALTATAYAATFRGLTDIAFLPATASI